MTDEKTGKTDQPGKQQLTDSVIALAKITKGNLSLTGDHR